MVFREHERVFHQKNNNLEQTLKTESRLSRSCDQKHGSSSAHVHVKEVLSRVTKDIQNCLCDLWFHKGWAKISLRLMFLISLSSVSAAFQGLFRMSSTSMREKLHLVFPVLSTYPSAVRFQMSGECLVEI